MMRYNLSINTSLINGTIDDDINDLRKIINYHQLILGKIIKNLSKFYDDLYIFSSTLDKLNSVNPIPINANFDKCIERNSIINRMVSLLRQGKLREYVNYVYGDIYNNILDKIDYDAL